MPQFGRPITDTANDGWTEDDGTAATIFDQIDESSADDLDYIRSPLAPTADVYVTKYSAVEDPQSSTGHVVRYRYRKDAAGGAQIDLTVELRQGYVNEGAPGTLIAQWVHANISDVITAVGQALSGAQADAITDYSNLFLRVVANQV